jgi:hypothetical protein
VRLAALLCCIGAATAAQAQISPGELSAPHASLEGLSNCTRCHSLGKAVTNAKCLDCHTELRTRIGAGTGYHAHIREKECVECHTEHHGRGFSIVHFDTGTFDHRETGWSLEGKHKEQKCGKCHTPAKIVAKDVLQNSTLMASRTFLGLPLECRNCHADAHMAQLGGQCQRCHGVDGWKPAAKFSHDNAKFHLTGKHQQVGCAKCHLVAPVDGKTVKYVGLSFDRCSSCHADPHNGKFKKPCESCHTSNGWREGSAKNFDHATTQFPLKGKHASVRCEACHPPARNASGGKIVQSFEVKNFQKCADCHKDAHRGEFAGRNNKGACESCHNEQGFSPTQFQHATARYRLEGKHEKTACARCHGEATTGADGKRVPVDFRLKKFERCADCHEDAHGNQFVRRKDKGACESCHRVEGFLPPKYSVADHEKARFVLTGGHEAVPCNRCHPADRIKAGSTRQFVWGEDQKCEACHKDPHGGQFPASLYAGCVACHAPNGWKDLVFEHGRTKFPLTGKHVGVACAECHKEFMTVRNEKVRRFTGAPMRCVDCHPEKDSPEFRAR